jgi:hypothetical protein
LIDARCVIEIVDFDELYMCLLGLKEVFENRGKSFAPID